MNKKALLIDVINRTVTSVDVDHYSEIYNYIGNDCHTFACPVVFDNEDTIFTDDEGLLKEVHGAFMMEGWNYPLVGNAIIMGSDEEGESTHAKSDPKEIESKIVWLDKEQAERWQTQALNTPPTIISF